MPRTGLPTVASCPGSNALLFTKDSFLPIYCYCYNDMRFGIAIMTLRNIPKIGLSGCALTSVLVKATPVWVTDYSWLASTANMDLLPDTQNCGLRMRRECRERFPRHRQQRKPLVSDPDMHHGTCVTHVPWCISGSLARGGREKVSGIPRACATRNVMHLARGPWQCNVLHMQIIFIGRNTISEFLCDNDGMRLWDNWLSESKEFANCIIVTWNISTRIIKPVATTEYMDRHTILITNIIWLTKMPRRKFNSFACRHPSPHAFCL